MARNAAKIVHDDSKLCVPAPGDVRKNPARCAIKHMIEEEHPWARHITVGTKTIRAYDYRCPHNSEGHVGRCLLPDCLRRGYIWATPLSLALAIKEFDRTGFASFPRIELRMSEAMFIPPKQDLAKKRKASAQYRANLKDGKITPNHMGAKAKARAMSNRRNG